MENESPMGNAKIQINQQAMKDLASRAVQAQTQALFDRVRAATLGADVSTVKAALTDEWRRTYGTTLTDPELSAWAEAIAATGVVTRVVTS
jgi:hypothetical protein